MSDLPRLMIARTVSLNVEHPACGTYVAHLVMGLRGMGWFSFIDLPVITNSRILDARNATVQLALDKGCDWILFVDPDMEPDVEFGQREGALPFFQSSFQFLNNLRDGKISGMDAGTLGVVGAPALSGPPEFSPNIMLYDETAEAGFRRVTHQECMDRPLQIERVYSVGTGVMLFPTKIFETLDPPWFEDLYKDEKKRTVWCSQDFYFCTRCHEKGIPVWANWYAWARHWKMCPIDRPTPALVDYLGGNLTSMRELAGCEESTSRRKAASTKRDESSLSDREYSSSSTTAPVPDFISKLVRQFP